MALLNGIRDWPAVKTLFRFIWKISARDQVVLSILAAMVFIIDLAPIGHQPDRETVNSYFIGVLEGAYIVENGIDMLCFFEDRFAFEIIES